jgi:hypothetical protein
MHTIFWSGNKGRDPLEDLSIDGRILFEWILDKCVGRVGTEFIWLRICTSGGLL